ncbi:replication factor C subunit 5 [Sphaeroforma arctica JP610]|uniref:Replication factor C subunit 5 n=1 Tax=Sphaeroforma arctica JP610 TaxID=667725 RepID=A0A0L0FTM9_9EUKA|nr:replication factor C subunit 5 [Sphaeroforma arctica JP610]KNC79931.1 replication factor C subunit 5 [Sphaeroforma arctica JP610]|eukprot:XP_014153833.1 replication factor C subunit 5 [Sphaeroforma arctica JP610]
MMGMSSDDDKGKGKAEVNHTDEEPRDKVQLPWVEKYRPKCMDDLVSHTDIISTIQTFIKEDRVPHMLFYGPPGTGKTSTILAVAQQIYGPKYKNMILELNASDDRGIDVVREKIKSFASTRTIFSSGYKLIILDEADAMTNAAQAALRRVIEKYTKNVRFCLICNYVSKIIPAVQSRCTSFRFAPLAVEQMEDRLQHVVASEKVNITPDGHKALLNLANGDMRKVLNVLQAAAMSHDVVDGDAVYLTTGQPLPSDITNIMNWLLTDDYRSAYNQIKTLKDLKGLALTDIIREVHTFTLNLELPVESKAYVMDELALLEYRLASGTSEHIQLGGMVGMFGTVRDQIAANSG